MMLALRRIGEERCHRSQPSYTKVVQFGGPAIHTITADFRFALYLRAAGVDFTKVIRYADIPDRPSLNQQFFERLDDLTQVEEATLDTEILAFKEWMKKAAIEDHQKRKQHICSLIEELPESSKIALLLGSSHSAYASRLHEDEIVEPIEPELLKLQDVFLRVLQHEELVELNKAVGNMPARATVIGPTVPWRNSVGFTRDLPLLFTVSSHCFQSYFIAVRYISIVWISSRGANGCASALPTSRKHVKGGVYAYFRVIVDYYGLVCLAGRGAVGGALGGIAGYGVAVFRSY